MEAYLKNCNLCPRKCGVNRMAGNKGYCHTSEKLIVARGALHFWEEPCISGENGSGTVFFSGCSLGCIYCQNEAIKKAETGKEITIDRLCDIFLELEEKGAENINLVTPTHYVLHIIRALEKAKEKGLSLPVVYNSGGYELPETLQRLEGLVDIYLPDFKYNNPETAKRYSNAQDYPEVAKEALDEMFRQQPKLICKEDGMLSKGMVVRHLVLPGHKEESKQAIQYLYETYGDSIYLSIMSQYTPVNTTPYQNLNRKLKSKEYEEVIDFAISLGIENAFIQEGEAAEESFIPPFSGEGV